MKKRTNYKHTIYACYLGYITQAVINNLAPLLFLIFQNRFQIELSQITLLVTVNFCVQLVVDFLAAKVVDRIGYRVSVMVGHACGAAGLIGLAVFPMIFPHPYVGLLSAVVLYAIGGGVIEVLVSPIVEACPSDNKEAAMSLLHSFYCWGTVAVVALSTAFLFVFGKEKWQLLACMWAIIPIANTILFSQVPIERLTEENEGMTMRELAKSKVFWLFFILMIAAGASEQAMSQWASAFAESGLGVSKAVGDLAGPCFFSILMGTSRALYAKFAEHLNLLSFMIGSGVLCIVSYLLAVFSPLPILSLLGCGLCGLSVGIMWPGVFSLASARMPRGGTVMFALLALSGDVGCGSGPTLVGFLAGHFSDNLKAGLFAAIMFPIILIAGIVLFLRNREERSNA